ncbi:hypothetical protein CGC20_37755 [Leishmania donovani]|uniref:Uncharacterized protein n=1 Tax=Leishmania donovani TaxID=5661 RepID=A0A504Y342_LEIDO|nr:hypothetical protein CGC20_37755 [Leishmania donovani]
MERNRCDRVPMAPLPRVCVALRWREARSWRMEDEQRRDAPAEETGLAAANLGVIATGPATGGAHTHIDPSANAPGSTSSEVTSRLCVLRQRYLPSASSLSASNVLRRSRHQHSRGGEVAHAGEAGKVVGLGMRDSDRSAAFPSSPSASARPATMEVVVQTPFIAVEGLGADAAAAASDYAQKRPVRPQHHADGPDSACLTYTDSCLTARLAEVIAEELLQGHALQRHGGVGSHRIRSASATTAAATGENREVLTFTMGPQGAANSSFLFGGTLGWPSRQRAAPTTVSQSSQALSGLFAAVLNRLFAPANAPADTRVVAAMSVTEVRDAAPLRHPSVLQRPRSTVDLLSGTVLRTEIDEVEGLDDSVDHPSDIPAACYVRVESIHDAMAVLYAALSCSAGWRHTHLLTGEAGHPEANALSSSPTAFAFLQPACEPLEERIDEAGHKRGSSGPAALLSAAPEVPAPVGIWKLWDVAGPSVSCGYRPLKTSSPKSAEGQGGRSAVGRTTTAPAAERRAAPAQLPTPRLPWSSRYSLAALTHTCLAEVGATLSTFALPLSRGPVDSLIPVLRHDTSTSLQIASSAVSSCSLVVPICAVVAEATVDDVNSEVLAAAAGWAALGREHQQEGQQHHQGLPRVRGLDNEDAARRVLHEYAVLLRDFVAERYGAADEGGTASPPFATARSPSASLMASQLPASNDEEGCSARQEAARVLRAPPMQASLPTSVAADSSRVAAASECGAALCVGAAPMRRMSMNTVAVGTHAAVTAPLSINVTGDAEDSPGFSLRPRVEADVRSTKLVDVLQRVHHQAHADTRAVGAVRSTDEAALSTAPPATAPASVADTCATAATHAEEARLQRFHALFESESFDVGEKAEATAAMEAWGIPALHLLCFEPVDAQVLGHIGVSQARSKDSERPCRQRHHTSASSLRYMTRWQTSTPPLPSAACDAAPHACEGPTHTPAPSLPPPDGALAAFLGPYCDEFVRLCGQMRTDVQAWRAHEAATLDQLSALAERHTRDIQEVATLQRRLAANFGTVDAMPGSSGASTLAGARDRRADVGALLRSALTGGNPDLAASHSATFASTSTLIFEQLVRSEEKVTWLERQLVDWRRRAREASILDTRSTNADAAPLIASEGDGESALELSSSPPAVASRVSATVGSVLSGPREDPAAPHMREAEALLRRLLQRCTRAYAAAQQQGDRWHAQLAQEQAAKSVLQDRVMELEAELAGLRRQRSVAALGSHSLYCTLDGVDAERSLLTAAPVSPIASDVASSLPSSSASRGLQRRCDDVAEPATLWDRMNAQRLATRGRNSAGDRAGTDSFGAVSTQLAVLLSRAVQGGDACAPSARTHPHVGTAAASSTSVAAPASLFEIHVGASSTVSSRGPDSPFRRDASRHSASASFSLAGNAPEVAARAGDRASDVESRERRQRRPPPSRSQHERHVEAATTPPSTTHRSARGIDEGTCGGEVLHHHVGTGTMKIGGGALVCAASHPPPSQCHATSAGELEVYPSAALEALERAATQLEAEAVRLCGAAHNTSSTAPCSQCHVAAIERRQLNGGDEVAVRRDEDIRAVHSSSPSSLCQSMGQLRSATQAVQREARDAAERERAYLSAILFSSTAAGSE